MKNSAENFLIGDFFKKHQGGQIFFGEKFDNGNIVHISTVDRGLACKCKCPECGDRLIAKKGKTGKQVHHFAHEANMDSRECYSPGETALHKLAKEIIARRMQITIPAVFLRRGGHSINRSAASKILINSVSLERRVGKIIPDIVCYHQDIPLFVEIAVTHFCDDEKISMLKSLGASTIEIDLSLYRDEKLKHIEEIIINRAPRNWLWNRKFDEMSNELSKIMIKERIADIEKKVNFFVVIADHAESKTFSFKDWLAMRAKQKNVETETFIDNDDYYDGLVEGLCELKNAYFSNPQKIPDDVMGLPVIGAFEKKIEVVKEALVQRMQLKEAKRKRGQKVSRIEKDDQRSKRVDQLYMAVSEVWPEDGSIWLNTRQAVFYGQTPIEYVRKDYWGLGIVLEKLSRDVVDRGLGKLEIYHGNKPNDENIQLNFDGI